MLDTRISESLDIEVRQFIDHIRPRVPTLEVTYSRELRKAGFDTVATAALKCTSPLAIAALTRGSELTTFWRALEAAGRKLAKMNVTPVQVTNALTICDDLINRVDGCDAFSRVRERLRFATILALNQAYHDVREEEHRAFYKLLEIEGESSSTNVLLSRLLESVAEACCAQAACAYLTASDTGHWEVCASLGNGVPGDHYARVSATPVLKRALAKVRRVTKPAHILDGRWPQQYESVWSVPVGDEGVLQFAFAGDRELFAREIEMLSVAGDRCYAATRKTRVLEHIARREEQLSKLAIQMLMVEQNERRRISRELHDDAGQSLVVIRLQMELIEQLLPENSEERERLCETRDITEKTILDIRRLISDLSPAVLDQLGLGAALRQLVNRFRSRYPCQVDLNVGQLPTLKSNFELVIYRLAQECLNNIARHSAATRVKIGVSTTDRVLRLHVEDNGRGFDVAQALERTDSFGLIGIRERVAVLGGTVEFSSTRKEGQPTHRRKKSGSNVRIRLPIT